MNTKPQSKTWYQTRDHYMEISPVEVERETDSFIWVNGYRTAKFSNGMGHFKTFEEAKEYLISRAAHRVSNAEMDLIYAKKKLEKAKQLCQNETTEQE